MKKFTLLAAILMVSFSFLAAQNFPFDFESETITFEDFDGGASSVILNPQSSGINTSDSVAQMVKGAGEIWAGSKIIRTSTISFTTNQVFSMKVYSPKVGANILFKLEKADDYNVAESRSALTTVANAWETVSFDFSGSSSDVYTHITIIFDNGTAGDGSADWTFLIDDIAFAPSPAPALALPIDFEDGPYVFTDFDGGAATVIANPQSSGENTSSTVAQIVRDGGQTWGGSKIVLNDKIDFSNGATISMKVFSPRVDVPVLFKLEGGDAQTELSVNTTVANQWETLTWDFTGQPSDTYNALVFMFDFGVVGDGTANSTFLFDDIVQIDATGGLTQIDLPVTFDGETVDFTVTDFGGNSTVIGLDLSDATNMVAITTKTAGSEGWAGTTIGTALGFASRVLLTTENSTMSVKVYSPKAGIQVRLKGEDANDDTKTVETEATTTVANAWETLVFDFNNVAEGTNPFDPNTNFNKFSIFFDFSVAGDASVYYWDDVEFGGSASAIANVESSAISFYTSNGVLHMTNNEEMINGTLNIYGLNGQLIFSQKINSTNDQISLPAQGLLIIRALNSNQIPVKTQKVLLD